MNKLFVALLVVIGLVLLRLLAPILTPFLVGGLIAYLVNPLVEKLMRLHLSRVVVVVIVFLFSFLIFLSLVLLLVPLIQDQIALLPDMLPGIVAWLQTTLLPFLKEHFGVQQIIDVNLLKTQLAQNLGKAGGAATWLLQTVLHSGAKLLHWLMNLLLIPVVTFYLLYDWNKIIAGLNALLPMTSKATITQLAKECDEVLGAFFRGQLLVMLSLSLFYSIGLSIIGIKIGVVIGVIIGLLSIVPYLGIIVGIATATIAAYLQFGTFFPVCLVLLLFAVGQALDAMFITPKLVGDRIGLHPVAVIFSVLAFGTLFGFLGVLLALPTAAIIMVLLRFLNRHYYQASISSS